MPQRAHHFIAPSGPIERVAPDMSPVVTLVDSVEGSYSVAESTPRIKHSHRSIS
jgi:hypothetical protein